MRLPRPLLAMLGLTLATAILSCSSSTSPGGGGDLEVLAEAAIGPDGGMLEAGGMAIAVPAGMLDQTTTLTLLRDTSASFGAHAATEAVQLRGLPAGAGGMLAVTLPSVLDAPVDTAMVAVRRFRRDLPAASSTWSFVEVHDVAEAFVAEVPINAVGEVGKADDLLAEWTLVITGLVDFARITVGSEQSPPTLTIIFPRYSRAAANDLADALEEAVAAFGAVPFSRRYEERPWAELERALVFFNPFERDATWPRVRAECAERYYRNDDTPLFIKTMIDIDDTEVTPANWPALALEIQQGLYHGYHAAADPYLRAPQIREMIKQWSAGLLLADPDHVPAAFAGHAARPLAGLKRYTEWLSNWQTCPDGIGYASLAKYIAEHPSLGQATLRGLLDRVAAAPGDVTPFYEAIALDPGVWWPGYVRALVEGELYPIATAEILALQAGQFRIARTVDTLRVFTRGMVSLEAAPYRIDPERADFTATDRLTLSLDHAADGDQVSLLVYELHQGTLTFLAQDHEALTVTGLDQLQATGADLIALVCNAAPSYTPQAPLNVVLTVRQQDDGQHPVFGQTRLDAALSNVRRDLVCTGTQCWQPSWSTSEALWLRDIDGAWNGTTFEAEWDRSFPAGSPYGGMRVEMGVLALTVSEDGSAVVALVASQTTIYGNGDVETFSIVRDDLALPLPFDDDVAGYAVGYRLSGPEVCTGLLLDYRYEYDDLDALVTMSGFGCPGTGSTAGVFFKNVR